MARVAGGEGHCDALGVRDSPFPLSRALPVSHHAHKAGLMQMLPEKWLSPQPRGTASGCPAPCLLLSPYHCPPAWPLLCLEPTPSAYFPFPHLPPSLGSITLSQLLLLQTSASWGSEQ